MNERRVKRIMNAGFGIWPASSSQKLTSERIDELFRAGIPIKVAAVMVTTGKTQEEVERIFKEAGIDPQD